MTNTVRVLAIDIGGTNSRFAEFCIDEDLQLEEIAFYHCHTNYKAINSFADLFATFMQERSTAFSELDAIDATTLAVPGPVSGKTCMPPNIDWNIDLSTVPDWQHAALINDFTAQGYACLLPEFAHQLQVIQDKHHVLSEKGTRSAVIGAGTGLGHCLLLENERQPMVVPSEAGYTSFSFVGDEEREYESFLADKLTIDYPVNDVIVSGSGLERLHAFLSGESKTAEQILLSKPRQTMNWFARFYGRVCRNYCLAQAIDHRLIISGGLAAKHPDIIQNEALLQEFYHGAEVAYRNWLEGIQIVLNRDEQIGLKGAAYHAVLSIQG